MNTKTSSSTTTSIATPTSTGNTNTLNLKSQLKSIFLLIMNFIVVCLVNGAFVGILLYEKVSLQFLATIFVIIFKLIWNPAIIIPTCSKLGISNITTFYILVFNNVIIPILATASVDVSCFQHLILVPPDITDSYLYSICTIYANNTCQLQRNQVVTSSVDPPFIYSYQCSSALLKNYVSVYVAMYAFSGLILPIIRIGCMLYFNECFTSGHGRDGKSVRSSWIRGTGTGLNSNTNTTNSNAENESESVSDSESGFGSLSHFSRFSKHIYRAYSMRFSTISTTSTNTDIESIKTKQIHLNTIKNISMLYPLIRGSLPLTNLHELLLDNTQYSPNDFIHGIKSINSLSMRSSLSSISSSNSSSNCSNSRFSSGSSGNINPNVDGGLSSLRHSDVHIENPIHSGSSGGGTDSNDNDNGTERGSVDNIKGSDSDTMSHTHNITDTHNTTDTHSTQEQMDSIDSIEYIPTPESIPDVIDIDNYFKSSSDMVANTSFYKIQANCLNAAVGLVVLFTFGLAYPPLAIIISMYLILSTLVMQICVHNHYLQVSSINMKQNEESKALVKVWHRIINIEIQEIQEILFKCIRPTVFISASFFSLF